MATITIEIPENEIAIVTKAICDDPNATLEEAKAKLLENINNAVTAYSYAEKMAIERAKLEEAKQTYDLAVTQIVVDEVAVSII
jgi:hypothetical protein